MKSGFSCFRISLFWTLMSLSPAIGAIAQDGDRHGVAVHGSKSDVISMIEDVQRAIREDDVATLFNFTHGSIRTTCGRDYIEIRTLADFTVLYTHAITQEMKERVLAESYDTLFMSWRGLGFGRGDLWVSQILPDGGEEWVTAIKAFNWPRSCVLPVELRRLRIVDPDRNTGHPLTVDNVIEFLAGDWIVSEIRAAGIMSDSAFDGTAELVGGKVEISPEGDVSVANTLHQRTGAPTLGEYDRRYLFGSSGGRIEDLGFLPGEDVYLRVLEVPLDGNREMWVALDGGAVLLSNFGVYLALERMP